MDKTYEEKYHQLEETNWWYEARRDMVLKLLSNNSKQSNILELGCAGGPLLRKLATLGFEHVQGIDISEAAISVCRKRGIMNAQVMDGTRLDFPDQHFDLLIASDVLEHIEAEEKALQEWNRVLKPGGQAIIFVPAFQWMWSGHDEVNHHFRRYTRNELVEKLMQNGFRVTRSSYWNLALFFPAGAIRLILRNFSSSEMDKNQHPKINPLVNDFLVNLIKMENRFLEKVNFPVGVSTFAVAKKL
ncbi:MAG: class I SAM-dependent methyltransferase [Bacteroidia bacterium]